MIRGLRSVASVLSTVWNEPSSRGMRLQRLGAAIVWQAYQTPSISPCLETRQRAAFSTPTRVAENRHCSDLPRGSTSPPTIQFLRRRVRARRIHRRRRRSYRHLHSSRKSIEHGFGMSPQSELMPSDSPLTTLWESSPISRGTDNALMALMATVDRGSLATTGRTPASLPIPGLSVSSRLAACCDRPWHRDFNGLRLLWSVGRSSPKGIVAQKRRDDQERPRCACTGIVLARNIVLTAAHCTSDATELTVYRTPRPAHELQGNSLWPPTQYDAKGLRQSQAASICVAEACVGRSRSSCRLRMRRSRAAFLASDSSSLGLGTPRPDLQPGLARLPDRDP